MTTQAENIAALFGNDGQVFENDEGQRIEETCEGHQPVRVDQDWDHEATRWVFDDGSWLAIVGGCWFTEDDADGENCYWPGD